MSFRPGTLLSLLMGALLLVVLMPADADAQDQIIEIRLRKFTASGQPRGEKVIDEQLENVRSFLEYYPYAEFHIFGEPEQYSTRLGQAVDVPLTGPYILRLIARLISETGLSLEIRLIQVVDNERVVLHRIALEMPNGQLYAYLPHVFLSDAVELGIAFQVHWEE